jgi:hypothetical protein
MKASVPAPWLCLSVLPAVRVRLRQLPVDSVLPELPDSVQPPAEHPDSVLQALLVLLPAASVLPAAASVPVAWA